MSPAFFVSLVTAAQLVYVESDQNCSSFSYIRRPEFADYYFTTGLINEMSYTSSTDCFRACYHHPQCNMVLKKLSARQCWLYAFPSTDLQYVQQHSGLEYFAADCQLYKPPPPICPENFATFDGEGPVSELLQCHNGSEWRPGPPGPKTCKQIRWIAPVSSEATDYYELPQSNAVGLVLDIRGARKDEADVNCAFRAKIDGQTAEIRVLRIMTNGMGSSAVYYQGWKNVKHIAFPAGYEDVFDVKAIFHDSLLELLINDQPFSNTSLPIMLDSGYVVLKMTNWVSLAWINLTYPSL